ncbi:MAG: DUF2142 domain-containing protein [Erysipelotrichaceae bacterium]|nr:DUF2142 domain-containing protein [Erysipelotrichaceae bacterium]
MKKKLTVIWLSLALLAGILCIRMGMTRHQERYYNHSLSTGTISRIAVADGDLLETTVTFPEETPALALNVRYAIGTETAGKYLHLDIMNASKQTVYSGDAALDTVGFLGDTNNDGCFLFSFPEDLKGTYTLQIRTGNITPEDNVQLSLQNSAGIGDEVLLNGVKQKERYLMGNYYTHGTPVSVSDTLLTFFLLEAVLFAGWFLLTQRVKEERKPVSFSFAKKDLLLLLSVLLAEVLVFEYGYANSVQNGIDEVREINGRGTRFVLLEPGESLESSFTGEMNGLEAIGLNTPSFYDESFSLSLQVLDKQGNVAAEALYDMDDLIDKRANEDKRLFFPQIEHSKNHEYTLKLSYLQGSETLHLRSSEEEGTPYLRAFYRQYPLIGKLYLLLCAILAAGSILLLLTFRTGKSPTVFFLSAFLPLLLTSTLFLIPMSVPDEYAHFDTAYALSNEILGIPDPYYDALYKRESDLITDPVSRTRFNGETYLRFYTKRSLTAHRSDELKMVYGRDVRSDSAGFFYLPAALGLTLGRLLGSDLTMTFYLARLGNMIAATAILLLAVKRAGRDWIQPAALALLPLSLRQIGSVSPDALIIPLGILLCVLLKKMSSEEKKEMSDLLVSALAALILLFCKGGAYAPLTLAVFLFLLLFLRKTENKAVSRRLLGICVLFGAFALFRWGPKAFSLLKGSQSSAYSSRLGKWLYSGSYLFSHPLQLLRIAEGTLYSVLPGLISSVIGTSVGWINHLTINQGIQYFLIAFMAVTVFRKTERPLSSGQRCLFVIVFLLVAGAFAWAMLTGWTALGLEKVNGLQSRYLLPVVLLPVYALQNKRFFVSVKDERRLLIVEYALVMLGLVSLCIAAWG